MPALVHLGASFDVAGGGYDTVAPALIDEVLAECREHVPWCQKVVADLCRRAALIWDCPPEQVQWQHGCAVCTDPAKDVKPLSLAAIAARNDVVNIAPNRAAQLPARPSPVARRSSTAGSPAGAWFSCPCRAERQVPA